MKKLATGTILVLSSFVCGSWTAQAVTFVPTVIDANGPRKVWGKGVGDLNGDGRDDLIIGSQRGGLYWYENPGWSKRTINATAPVEEDMDVIDLDRDGRKDIVAVVTGGLTWFQNTTSGWIPTPLVTGLNLHDVVVADFDGDGKLDLAGRNQGRTGNVMYLWRQIALNSWQRSTITLPAPGEGLAPADLDADGKVDLVIGENWLRNVSTSGAMSFSIYQYNLAASMDSYVDVGDVNGDGRLDIVTSPAEPAGGYHQILWFQNPPNPLAGWTRHVIENNVERCTHFVGAADLDLDGDLDVASALTQKAAVPAIKWHVNSDGAGAFAVPPTIIANASSHSMKFVRVGSDAGLSLFGADYDNTVRTPIMLYRWTAD